MNKILITGAAGFIGFHLCERLLDRGERVVGIDNLNDYYDVSLKHARLNRLIGRPGFQFLQLDLTNREGIASLFSRESLDVVVNLAAQAGVRYSLINPLAYGESNIMGFLNILEGCRKSGVKHLVFASSSSVYGGNQKVPFSEHDPTDHPVSLYAVTKKANELAAHSYASLYCLPCTGLRFFTVYGPWGRPDMAYYSFTKAIMEGRPIDVFNHGNMMRDFTYIDDIIEGVVRVIDRVPKACPAATSRDAATSAAPYRLYNIGNNRSVELLRFIQVLEKCIGLKARINLLPMQPGDVPATYASIDDLMHDVGFAPSTPIELGFEKFVSWYREFYNMPALAISQVPETRAVA